MKPSVLPLLGAALISCFGPAAAGPKPKSSPPPTVPHDVAPETPRLFEFKDDDLVPVLRFLAECGQINLYPSREISGAVSLRLEGKTPLEAIKIIVENQNLNLTQKNTIYWVRTKAEVAAEAAGKAEAEAEAAAAAAAEKKKESRAEAAGSAANQYISGYYDPMLDYLARPETAQKVAKEKKQLYDALITEGFAKEDALRIVISNPTVPSLPPGR